MESGVNKITERLMYSTVRVIACDSEKNEIGTGTGFFYEEQRGGETYPFLVTNKHVLENAHFVTLCLHSSPEKGAEKTFWARLSQCWIDHPGDVDLSLIPFAVIENNLEEDQSVFKTSVGKDIIPKQSELEELEAIEEVLMIGYPNGLWDDENNFPIFRKGVTASHPAVDFRGKKITVIDAACFSGSSGSPVFVFNQGGYYRDGSFVVGTRLIFLGVLSSGPVMKSSGEIEIEEIPTGIRARTQNEIPINLGYVIKPLEVEKLVDKVINDYQDES